MQLITIGKLISTTDIKMASFLNQTVLLNDICHGRTPQQLRQSGKNLSFMFNGDFYELEAAL